MHGCIPTDAVVESLQQLGDGIARRAARSIVDIPL